MTVPSSLSVLPSWSTCSAFGRDHVAGHVADDLQNAAIVVHCVGLVRGRVIGVAVVRAREIVFLDPGQLGQIDVIEQELDVFVIEKEIRHNHTFFLYRFYHHGNHLLEIADDAVMGHRKDRRLRVLVYGHDLGRLFHPGAMLYRAADAHGDVQGRAHGGSGLADLVFLADVPAVDCRAACPDRPGDCAGQIVNQFEIILAADAAAPGHDHPGAFEVDFARFEVPFDQFKRQLAVVEFHFFFDTAALSRGIGRFQGHHALADRGHLRPLVEIYDRGDDIPAEGRADLQEQIFVLHLGLRVHNVADFQIGAIGGHARPKR